jgi:cellulose synthase (UDP-forming)
MAFYFEPFENRKPPEPVPYYPRIELLWQFLIVIALVFGARYIYWRWSVSLNYDALWFAVPLALAETLAYIGVILFTVNLWQTRDYPMLPPPESIGECLDDPEMPERPVAVDIFIATYNEDEELVRLTIRDAKAVRYPHAIDMRIHVLDDGRRASMRQVCDEEGINYITRTTNIGFKAGNMRNAMEQTSGDFIVICDSDTRLFPSILENTLGYFRDPDVAWIQTPQWFFDLPQGRALPDWLARYAGTPGRWIGRAVEKVAGPVRMGYDPFVSDPQMFYDLILRRRNAANAAFCCGAASIHRREAVMQSALRAYSHAIETEVKRLSVDIKDEQTRRDFEDALHGQMVLETEFTPYKFHVSEDIYTSIVLHNDPERRWKSVMHPKIESKMLSPQDLLSWAIQRFKYAGGTLDIMVRDNPHDLSPACHVPKHVLVIPGLPVELRVSDRTDHRDVHGSLAGGSVFDGLLPALPAVHSAQRAGVHVWHLGHERLGREGIVPVVLLDQFSCPVDGAERREGQVSCHAERTPRGQLPALGHSADCDRRTDTARHCLLRLARLHARADS